MDQIKIPKDMHKAWWIILIKIFKKKNYKADQLQYLVLINKLQKINKIFKNFKKIYKIKKLKVQKLRLKISIC
jgi:hypothetical protein